MKKAIEYAEEYKLAKDKDRAVYEVAVSMFREIGEIAKGRKTTSDQSLLSIFNEVNLKWKAFARRVGVGVNLDGFSLLIKKQMPDLHSAMMATRTTQEARKKRTHSPMGLPH